MTKKTPLKFDPVTYDVLKAAHRRFWAGTASEKVALKNAEDFLSLCSVGHEDCKDPLVSRISSGDIEFAIGHWKGQGVAPATINRKLAAGKRVLDYACKLGKRTTPCPELERLEEPPGRDFVVDRDLEAKIYAICDNPRAHNLDHWFAWYVFVSIDTGLRQGEFLKLRRKDYLESHVTVSAVISKNGRARSVPLTGRARKLFQFKVSTLPDPGCNPEALIWGADITPQAISRNWQILREALKIDHPDFVPHCLRHTFGSRLVALGVPIHTVSKLMGHSSVRVTERYAHYDPNGGDGAIQRLDELNDLNEDPDEDLVAGAAR